MAFDRYLANSAPSTAASSSNRGIVCGFMGATLLLDITNVHFVPRLGVVSGSIPGLGTSFGQIDQTELCTFYGVYSIPPRFTVCD